MRNFINIISETLLVEAHDYKGMFRKYFSLDPSIEPFVDDEIKWARQHLKKNDRVVWYLNFIRHDYLQFLENRIAKGEDPKDSINMAKRYIPHFHDVILHFLSLPIAKIQNFVFPSKGLYDDVIGQFRDWENEWKETRKGTIPHNPDDKVFIQFPDGFAWVILDRKSCKLEGDAMGHCGNTATPREGQRILSLRKKGKVGNEDVWLPSLTFILNKDGTLGEMKGRANEKPHSKYHQHIIKLLLSDMVTGIVGGGHQPEKNFQINDLTDEQIEHIRDTKPQILPVSVQYNLIDDPDERTKFIIDHLVHKVFGNYREDVTVEGKIITVYDGNLADDHIRVDKDTINFFTNRGIEGYKADQHSEHYLREIWEACEGVADDQGSETMSELVLNLADKYGDEAASNPCAFIVKHADNDAVIERLADALVNAETMGKTHEKAYTDAQNLEESIAEELWHQFDIRFQVYVDPNNGDLTISINVGETEEELAASLDEENEVRSLFISGSADDGMKHFHEYSFEEAYYYFENNIPQELL